MFPTAPALLISELEGSVKSGSLERRIRVLGRVRDLSLPSADRLNDNHIAAFGDVLVQVIERMETQALVRLSATLAECDFAPKELVRQLARHEDPSVAAPVLARSTQLSDDDLTEIANTRGQHHLLAISGRDILSETITDVLVERGDQSVSRNLAANVGARFSWCGYLTLAKHAVRDGALAEALSLRLGIPLKTLGDLLSRTTAAVRAAPLEVAPPPEMRNEVQEAIRNIAGKAGIETPNPVDYTEA